MGAKRKYYVVWEGREPGVYGSWDECLAQVHGCPGAVYKSFKTEAEARAAFASPAADYVRQGRPAAASAAATAMSAEVSAMSAEASAALAEASAETPLSDEKLQPQSVSVPLPANGLPPAENELPSSANGLPSSANGLPSSGNGLPPAASDFHSSENKLSPLANEYRSSANGLPPSPPDYRNDTVLPLPMEVRADALAVDAACSGNPGPMEYRGVDLATGQEVFRYGPVHGTNNIGEFLAIVHALALLRQRGCVRPVYSDSRNALLWVRMRKCRTKLERTPKTESLFQLIARAETWLRTHDWSDIPLLKWETERWGEIPADFGRK